MDVNCFAKCVGGTPLLLLCRNNQSDTLYFCLKSLLERKEVDLSQLTKKMGHNALTLLCRHYRNSDLIDCVRLLIKRGVDLTVKDRDKRNAMMLLCEFYSQRNLIDIARLMIYYQIDLFHSAEQSMSILQLRGFQQESSIMKNITDIARQKNGRVNNAVIIPSYSSNKLTDLYINWSVCLPSRRHFMSTFVVVILFGKMSANASNAKVL